MIPQMPATGPTTRIRTTVSMDRNRRDSATVALAAPSPSRARPMTKYV